MARLSVNVNKVATLRNARGKHRPDLKQVTHDIIQFGAQSITIHPRPDERHIRKTDVYVLNELLLETNTENPEKEQVEFNIEGYPSDEYLALMSEINPHQCTLVPDPPEALTSNAGWDLTTHQARLTAVVNHLKDLKIRVSLFIDVFNFDENQKESLLSINPDRVELYTERFADDFGSDKLGETLSVYRNVAFQLHDLGFGINAGHDLNLNNIQALIDAIPIIKEVSIGHALICESLYEGFKAVIQKYLEKVDTP